MEVIIGILVDFFWSERENTMTQGLIMAISSPARLHFSGPGRLDTKTSNEKSDSNSACQHGNADRRVSKPWKLKAGWAGARDFATSFYAAPKWQ